MPKTISVTVEDHFAEFIQRTIDEGRYESPTHVIEAGLKLLEEQEAKFAALRAALIEGELSGPGEAFDFEEFIRERRRRPSSG